MSEQVDIFIKSPYDQSIGLKIALNSRIDDLICSIENRFVSLGLANLNWRHHFLLFRGKLLTDHGQTLHDLNIQRDDCIWIRTRVG